MVLTKLQGVLEDRNMTIAELAVKTMLSVSAIQNAKKGRGVSLATAKRIAQSLKMDLCNLK